MAVIPESPRWLFVHGRGREAEDLVADVERSSQVSAPREDLPTIAIHERKTIGFVHIARSVFRDYPRRATLGLASSPTWSAPARWATRCWPSRSARS